MINCGYNLDIINKIRSTFPCDSWASCRYRYRYVPLTLRVADVETFSML